MKVVKWGSVIAVTCVVTCILLFTFTQEPFNATAPVKILWYVTPNEFPLYLFVAATFAMGLLIGFFAAAYYYITGQAGIHNKKKEIYRLKGVIEGLTRERELEQARNVVDLHNAIDDLQQKTGGTESMKAIGEKDLFS